jgi:hypothetical protein
MTTVSSETAPARVAGNVLELIGETPLLRLGRYSPEGGAAIVAKLEFLNPGGSIKDRAALGMIEAAEAAGLLKAGATIVEPTAGNTGVGLALVGISRGYRVIVVVPEKFVGPKTVVMGALGAEIVLTPTEKGMEFAIARARELAARIRSSSRTSPTRSSTTARPRASCTRSSGGCPTRSCWARARAARSRASPATARSATRACAPCWWSPRARSGAEASRGRTRSRGSATRSGRRRCTAT